MEKLSFLKPVPGAKRVGGPLPAPPHPPPPPSARVSLRQPSGAGPAGIPLEQSQGKWIPPKSIFTITVELSTEGQGKANFELSQCSQLSREGRIPSLSLSYRRASRGPHESFIRSRHDEGRRALCNRHGDVVATRQAGPPPWEEPRDTEGVILSSRRRVDGGAGSEKSAQAGNREAETWRRRTGRQRGRSRGSSGQYSPPQASEPRPDPLDSASRALPKITRQHRLPTWPGLRPRRAS